MDLRAQVAALTGAPPVAAPAATPDPDEWSLSKDELLHLDETEQANIAALIDEAATPEQPQAPPAQPIPNGNELPAAPAVPVLDLGKIDSDIAALEASKAAFLTKFEDGEINAAEFNRQLAAYTQSLIPLQAQRTEAATQQSTFEQEWDRNVGTFMGQRGFVAQPALVSIFDTHLIDVGTRHPQMGQAERMEWAYGKMVTDAARAGLPIPVVSAQAPQVGIAPTPSAQPPVQDPRTNQGLGGVPPTLNSLPASMESAQATGQYAHVQALLMSNNLDGYTQAETLMSRMSEEQLDAFLERG